MRVTQHHPSTSDEAAEPHSGPFAIEVDPARRATTVRVTGELDAASASQLQTTLVGAGEGGRDVLLDLERTTFIDSAGIRVLVRSMWDLRDGGSSLQLVAASAMAENILRITGILDVLKDPAP